MSTYQPKEAMTTYFHGGRLDGLKIPDSEAAALQGNPKFVMAEDHMEKRGIPALVPLDYMPAEELEIYARSDAFLIGTHYVLV